MTASKEENIQQPLNTLSWFIRENIVEQKFILEKMRKMLVDGINSKRFFQYESPPWWKRLFRIGLKPYGNTALKIFDGKFEDFNKADNLDVSNEFLSAQEKQALHAEMIAVEQVVMQSDAAEGAPPPPEELMLPLSRILQRMYRVFRRHQKN